MAKVDGSRVILMVDKESNGALVAIAYATELEMTMEATTIKVAPIADGGWDNHKKQYYDWRITINHLLSMVRASVDIEQLIEADEEVKIVLAIVPPGGFDPADVEAEEVMLQGMVKFKRMTITGQQGGMSVMSVELLGNDELLEA